MSKSDSLENKPSILDKFKKLGKTIALASVAGVGQLAAFEHPLDRLRIAQQADPHHSLWQSIQNIWKSGVYVGFSSNVTASIIKQSYRNVLLVNGSDILSPEFKAQHPYEAATFVAFMMGSTETLFTTPIKQIKTRIMTNPVKRSMFETMSDIGIANCYKGGTAVFAQYTTYWALYGAMHHYLMNTAQEYNHSPEISVPQRVMMAVTEAFLTTTLTNPLDLARTTMQRANGVDTNLFTTLADLYKKNGTITLFKSGLLPRLLIAGVATFVNNAIRDVMSSTPSNTPAFLNSSTMANEYHAQQGATLAPPTTLSFSQRVAESFYASPSAPKSFLERVQETASKQNNKKGL